MALDVFMILLKSVFLMGIGFILGLAIFMVKNIYYGNISFIAYNSPFWEYLPVNIAKVVFILGFVVLSIQAFQKWDRDLNRELTERSMARQQKVKEDIALGKRSPSGHWIECVGNQQYLVIEGYRFQRVPYKNSDGTHKTCNPEKPQ